MSKAKITPAHPTPDWTDAGARVRWLLENKFGGNRSAMARAIGFSHTVIANVVKGKVAPGRFLLDAIVERLGVAQDWLRAGVGQPFSNGGGAGMPAGVAVTDIPLPGPPLSHAAMINSGWVDLPGTAASPSVYWLVLKSSSPVVRRASSGFHPGDHLLMEADPANFPRADMLYESLCVVKKGPELLLAYVTHHPASVDEGDERLEADFPTTPFKSPDVVERVYRHLASGEIHFFERSPKRVKGTGMEAMLPAIHYGDIVAVWKKIIHRTFG